MKKIQLYVLVITSALCTAFSIENDSTDLDEKVERSSRVANECFPKPVDCEEVLMNGNRNSGVYTIWPRNRKMSGKSVEVYCDMVTDGGGWTVLQRRGNYGKAMNYFNKTWDIYKNGFGQLEKEFWIGNDLIFTLTNQGSYSVRFDMRHHNGTSAYALYDTFWIEDEDKKYQLNIDGYSGNAGDSMSIDKAMKFTTLNQDNSPYSGGNCAARYSGAWWYNSCGEVTFNGLYRPGKYTATYGDGIHWDKFSKYPDSLEFTEIKIRSMYFK